LLLLPLNMEMRQSSLRRDARLPEPAGGFQAPACFESGRAAISKD
jgi:hypothetical protein